jgi:hypothetical protein
MFAPMSRALGFLCLVWLCLCSLPASWMEAQTARNSPAPLLMPESGLPAKLTVPVFGQKIAFYDIGSGPVVVLVHGFGSEARFDWGNVILPLAEHHRVIALDQIGFGASDKPFVD